MRASVRGVESVLQAIGKAKVKDPPVIQAGLLSGAQSILKKSQDYVPVDTSLLKLSGTAYAEGVGLGSRAYVVYETYYAIFVHEDLTKHHPVGQAKFLERAVKESQGVCAKAVQRALKIGASGSTPGRAGAGTRTQSQYSPIR